jgi:hypothetical protein
MECISKYLDFLTSENFAVLRIMVRKMAEENMKKPLTEQSLRFLGLRRGENVASVLTFMKPYHLWSKGVKLARVPNLEILFGLANEQVVIVNGNRAKLNIEPTYEQKKDMVVKALSGLESYVIIWPWHLVKEERKKIATELGFAKCKKKTLYNTEYKYTFY